VNTDPLRIPSPFPYRINPHAGQARTHTDAWVARNGLVRRESARIRFTDADFCWFAAMVYPTADAQCLDLMADWFAWFFLFDDHLDDGEIGRSLEKLGRLADEMRAVIESPDFGAGFVTRPGVPAVVSSLADLWTRTAPGMTPYWRQRFVQHVAEGLAAAAVWEAGNRVEDRVPDEATYIEKRRHTGAIYVCMDLIEVAERISLPPVVCESEPFRSALDAACDVVCWTNDYYSLDKERSLGEVHNLVHIVQHHRGLTTQEACTHVCHAISAETERYLSLERQLLEAHPDHAAALTPYAAGMRTWMRGNLDWSSRTRRYQSVTDPGPSGQDDYLESALLEG